MHALRLGQVGNKFGDTGEADDAQGSDSGEGDAPADGLPKERAEGYPDDIGDGQAGEHHRDGPGLLFRRHKIRGSGRTDSEEGAVGEGGDDSADQHDGEGGCDGGQQVADDEQPHQQHQHPLARDLGAKNGRDRGTEH